MTKIIHQWKLLQQASCKLFPDTTLSSSMKLSRMTWSLRGKARLFFRWYRIQKGRLVLQRWTACFLINFPISEEVYLLGTRYLSFHALWCESHEHNLSRKMYCKDFFHAVKVSQRTQSLSFKLRNDFLYFATLVLTYNKFLNTKSSEIFDCCWEKKDLTSQKLLNAWPVDTFSSYLKSWWSTIKLSGRQQKWRYKHYFTALLSFHFKGRSRRHLPTGLYMNNQTFSKKQNR